ncbi:hypothetical protein [Nocardioides sp. B-3]|nr:hypothetical protein [Nocardioides sp. B-3]
MLARWSRSADVPITTLASAVVEGTVDNTGTAEGMAVGRGN